MMTCALTLSLSPGLAFSVFALVSPSEDGHSAHPRSQEEWRMAAGSPRLPGQRARRMPGKEPHWPDLHHLPIPGQGGSAIRTTWTE